MIHEASDGRSCNHRSIVLEPAQCATDALANGIGVGPFKVREENRDRRRIGSLRVDEVPHALDVAADFAELSPQRRLGFPEFRMTPPEFRVAPSARGDDLGVGLELGHELRSRLPLLLVLHRIGFETVGVRVHANQAVRVGGEDASVEGLRNLEGA